MFDHLVKVYKHSDHTIVNEVVQCLECKECAEIRVGGGIMNTFVFP